MTLPGCSSAKVLQQPRRCRRWRSFGYGDVELTSEAHEKQLERTLNVLMGLSDDSMLKPLREMSGLPAHGEDLGGWYHYEPGLCTGGYGFAPSCTFGQWVSALARMYADPERPGHTRQGPSLESPVC